MSNMPALGGVGDEFIVVSGFFMQFQISLWFVHSENLKKKKMCVWTSWDFPGGPVVKTSPSKGGSVGSIPGQEAKIPTCLEATKPKHKRGAML